MTDPINTQNRPRATGVSTDTRAGATSRSNRASGDSKPGAGGAAGESAIVELSSAALLEELGEQIRNLPEVNEARVDAVRKALSSGEYEPDAEVIARKYREIEKLLP